jgi:hypothetical protein
MCAVQCANAVKKARDNPIVVHLWAVLKIGSDEL